MKRRFSREEKIAEDKRSTRILGITEKGMKKWCYNDMMKETVTRSGGKEKEKW